jgi:predicted nucleic acid-binding protein
MILVDTSVWIDHFQKKDTRLVTLLEKESVLVHPFIIGELACGNIKNRDEILKLLNALPQITTANFEEILFFIDGHQLFGRGIGYVDVHLIASCMMDNAKLYTRDKRLFRIAKEFNII